MTELRTPQAVMEEWKDWMLSIGLKEQTADRFVALGPKACKFLFEAVYA